MGQSARDLVRQVLVNVGDTVRCTHSYSTYYKEGQTYVISEIDTRGLSFKDDRTIGEAYHTEFEVIARASQATKVPQGTKARKLAANGLVHVGDRVMCTITGAGSRFKVGCEYEVVEVRDAPYPDIRLGSRVLFDKRTHWASTSEFAVLGVDKKQRDRRLLLV